MDAPGSRPATTPDDGPARGAGGRVVLAATPIGDVRDASPRLVDLLATADVVAAEDTRRLHRLASTLGVAPAGRVVRFDEHTEVHRSAELVAQAAAGALVLVVSDAGMPSVSDPGLRVVRAAVDAGVPVAVVPGPSAVLTALALSGLASDRFCFEGFLPRKAGERVRALGALATERRTMVFFESPRRVADTLAAMVEVLGAGRRAALCRELTKTYEEVVRLPLGELAAWASGREVLGEVSLVVAGLDPDDEPPADLDVLVAQVRARTAGGERLKDAVAAVAGPVGFPKRELYDAVTHSKQG